MSSLVILGAIGFALIVLLPASIKIVMQYEAGVVFFLQDEAGTVIKCFNVKLPPIINKIVSD